MFDYLQLLFGKGGEGVCGGVEEIGVGFQQCSVAGSQARKEDCMVTSSRANAVLLVRLRAGHTPLLKAYANLLDPSADPLCPLSKEEPQTVEHWLRRCPRFDATRQNIFGSPSPPLKVLTTDPERVLALARVTFG